MDRAFMASLACAAIRRRSAPRWRRCAARCARQASPTNEEAPGYPGALSNYFFDFFFLRTTAFAAAFFRLALDRARCPVLALRRLFLLSPGLLTSRSRPRRCLR